MLPELVEPEDVDVLPPLPEDAPFPPSPPEVWGSEPLQATKPVMATTSNPTELKNRKQLSWVMEGRYHCPWHKVHSRDGFSRDAVDSFLGVKPTVL